MAQHCKSHLEYKQDLAMPAEYFKDVLLPQLCSLFEEDALKDMTITLRKSSITMRSFMLSLLSPVLRTMVCGNFRESICKKIILDDIDVERLLKLLEFACGKEGLVAEGFEELLDLGELAERLQMTAVRIEVENKLFKELRVENCLEMLHRSEASGLAEELQKECYKMLRDNFEADMLLKEGLLKLSEETMGTLLEEDEIRDIREEDVFEAVVRWILKKDEKMRGVGLLRKIRYGIMSNEYLAGHMSLALLPAHGMVKELVGEAMAKKGLGDGGGEVMWDGVERLCDKWMVARGMKGKIIGTDVLKTPRCVTMDRQGRIVVSVEGLHQVIVFNHDGSVARRFGSQGAAAGQFNYPMGIAVDRQGHIVVADHGNHRIQVLNEDGSVSCCFGSKGTAVGRLNGPYGVAIDREGYIVVADSWNHRIQVFNEDGVVVRRFGSNGAAIGQFEGPTGVAVDEAGRIVVADWGNHRVQVFNGDGSVALCFGSEGSGPGQLKHPQGVAVDNVGWFVIADSNNHRIQVFDSDGSVAHVLATHGDGVGELSEACGVVVDTIGRIVVADCGNHRVKVF